MNKPKSFYFWWPLTWLWTQARFFGMITTGFLHIRAMGLKLFLILSFAGAMGYYVVAILTTPAIISAIVAIVGWAIGVPLFRWYYTQGTLGGPGFVTIGFSIALLWAAVVGSIVHLTLNI